MTKQIAKYKNDIWEKIVGKTWVNKDKRPILKFAYGSILVVWITEDGIAGLRTIESQV